MPKCLNCGSEYVHETEIIGIPFGCSECGYWGETINTVENPPPDEEWYREGQVPHRPVEE